MDGYPEDAKPCRDASATNAAKDNTREEKGNHNGSIERLGQYFTSNDGPTISSKKLSDEDLQQIVELLKWVEPKWSNFPRLYIVLRSIGQLQSQDDFIAQGVTDLWFPFSVRSCPSTMSQSTRQKFLEGQRIVFTKAMDLEKGEQGTHQYYAQDELLPFESKQRLGGGAFGEVDKVWSLLSRSEFARKRIRRGHIFQQQRRNMDDIANELEQLKRLKHHHIVELVGSYLDPVYVGLIFSPVADSNLSEFLLLAVDSNEKKELIRRFFGCLSSGLAYIHENRIRHKDIKPENILVYGDTVLFTDFGIAFGWEVSDRSTTQDTTPVMTRKYSAPEMFVDAPRNSSSDVWSLGCVFLEMITVLKGKPVAGLRSHLEGFGSASTIYAMNQDGVSTWMLKLKMASGSNLDSIPLQWTKPMLRKESLGRPTAKSLVDLIIKSKIARDYPLTFSGLCCQPHEDHDPEWSSSSNSIGVESRDHPTNTETSSSGGVPIKNHEFLSPSSVSMAALTLRNVQDEFQAILPRKSAPSRASIFAAIRDSNIERLKTLIQDGVDLESEDAFGVRVLFKAVDSEKEAIVRVLLEGGAEVNAQSRYGYTALHIAAALASEALVKLLLKGRADARIRAYDGWTALHAAVNYGSPSCTKLLIDAGSDINAQTDESATALALVAQSGEEETARLLLENNANPNVKLKLGRTALHQAAQYGQDKIIELLLDYGADVDCRDNVEATPLIIAANSRQESSARVLVDRGADLTCGRADLRGRNALHHAAANRAPEVINILVSGGANINAQDDDGISPLTLAASKGNDDCVQLLLDCGADIDLRGGDGSSALLHACMAGHEDTVKLLIGYGAEVNDPSLLGGTSLHAAAKKGHLGVARILLENGANVAAETVAGITPIGLAISYGHEALEELFLEAIQRLGGGNVNVFRSSGSDRS